MEAFCQILRSLLRCSSDVNSSRSACTMSLKLISLSFEEYRAIASPSRIIGTPSASSSSVSSHVLARALYTWMIPSRSSSSPPENFALPWQTFERPDNPSDELYPPVDAPLYVGVLGCGRLSFLLSDSCAAPEMSSGSCASASAPEGLASRD